MLKMSKDLNQDLINEIVAKFNEKSMDMDSTLFVATSVFNSVVISYLHLLSRKDALDLTNDIETMTKHMFNDIRTYIAAHKYNESKMVH